MLVKTLVTSTSVAEGAWACSLFCSINSSVGESFTVALHWLFFPSQNTFPRTVIISQLFFKNVHIAIFNKLSSAFFGCSKLHFRKSITHCPDMMPFHKNALQD